MKKRGSKITQSKVLVNIPHEVIFDIFVRLSIKDILRCRCVSKSWCFLISDPQFVRYHLDMAKRIDNLGSQRHISISRNNTIQSISHQTLRCEKLELSLPVADQILDYENLSTRFNDTEFLCSCDGLVLVGRDEKDHFLWNPCTRSYEQIPEIPFDFSNYQYCIEDCIRLYGIGYDMSTDAFKVVRIVRILKPKVNRRLEFTARTYNCKTKCWKRICDDFAYKLFKNAQGVVLNGVPHWIVARENNENEYVIIYFDVVDDTIEEIETPLPSSIGADFRFSNFEGSLCLVTTAERFSDVWVLQEDGANKRWKKLFRLEKDMHPFNGTSRRRFWFNEFVCNFVPLCYRNNKEILFEVRFKETTDYDDDIVDRALRLLTYDLESKAEDDFLTVLQQEANDFHSITYVESLVSPK